MKLLKNSIITPVLLIVSAFLGLFVYFVDESLIAPEMSVFLLFMLAAMGWLKYIIGNSVDQLTDMHDKISKQRDEFSRMLEIEVAKNLKMKKFINDSAKELQRIKEDCSWD